MFPPSSCRLWMLLIYSCLFLYFPFPPFFFRSSARSPVPVWERQASPLQARLGAVVPGADGWLQPALSSPSASQVTARPQAGAAGRGPVLLLSSFSLSLILLLSCERFLSANAYLGQCVCLCKFFFFSKNKTQVFCSAALTLNVTDCLLHWSILKISRSTLLLIT